MKRLEPVGLFCGIIAFIGLLALYFSYDFELPQIVLIIELIITLPSVLIWIVWKVAELIDAGELGSSIIGIICVIFILIGIAGIYVFFDQIDEITNGLITNIMTYVRFVPAFATATWFPLFFATLGIFSLIEKKTQKKLNRSIGFIISILIALIIGILLTYYFVL